MMSLALARGLRPERSDVSTAAWVAMGVFLALLVGGVGVLIWTAAQPHDDARRRARLLSTSGSVALAGLLGGVVLAAWSPGSSGMGGMMEASSSGSCPSQSEGAMSAAIQGFRFCPSPLRVPAGTTVTWTNGDNVAHTVSSRTGPHFDSGSLAQGGSWRHRFDRAGNFSYYCAIHPWMRATVEVT
jgi:plastocyanin